MTDSLSKKPTSPAHHRYLADDDEHERYAPVGLDTLLAATEKLLAVNRGIAEPDNRDSLPNDRVYTVDRLMSERVKLDHKRTLRTMMGRLSRARNLSPMGPDALGEYTMGFTKSNPLVPALEEINPMHILEQKRRITKMGPGGIGDPNAITDDMQMVDAAQFGFTDPIAGPECFTGDQEVYTARGWVNWENVQDTDTFACRVNGSLEWHKAEKITRQHYNGELIGVDNAHVRFLVTSNHRIVHKRRYSDTKLSVATIAEIEHNHFWLQANHEAYAGDPLLAVLKPTMPVVGQHELPIGSAEDWCELTAWFLFNPLCFLRSNASDVVYVSQACEWYEDIQNVCLRLGVGKSDADGRVYITHVRQLMAYLSKPTDDGGYQKAIPEELFETPVSAREKLLNTLLLMERTYRSDKHFYRISTLSASLAASLERLVFSLGYPSYLDDAGAVKVVSIFRRDVYHVRTRLASSNTWTRAPYNNLVYCATVPGSMLHVRGKRNTAGHWSGNSEKAGIDVRLSHGARVGSDGKIYQLLLNRKTGRKEWVSPSDLRGKTLKLPD